jgi:hypothetical protein
MRCIACLPSETSNSAPPPAGGACSRLRFGTREVEAAADGHSGMTKT